MAANELRGEVDIVLDGMTFALRPSYEAVERCEKEVGMSLIEMALAADDGSLRLGEAAVLVTEFVKAWGASGGEQPTDAQKVARAVNAKRIKELVFEFGLYGVLPRLAIVLSRAASGGVLASGEQKAPVEETTTSIPGAEPQASRPQRSGGTRKGSGAARATSSGPRSKRGRS